MKHHQLQTAGRSQSFVTYLCYFDCAAFQAWEGRELIDCYSNFDKTRAIISSLILLITACCETCCSLLWYKGVYTFYRCFLPCRAAQCATCKAPYWIKRQVRDGWQDIKRSWGIFRQHQVLPRTKSLQIILYFSQENKQVGAGLLVNSSGYRAQTFFFLKGIYQLHKLQSTKNNSEVWTM